MRQTLALVVLAIGLAATLALAGIIGETVRVRMARQIGISLVRHATLVAATLDRGLYDRWRELEVTAALDAARLIEGSDQERMAVLDRTLASHHDFVWVGYADRRGIVRAATQGLLVAAMSAISLGLPRGPKPLTPEICTKAAFSRKRVGPTKRSPAPAGSCYAVRDAAGQTVGVLGVHFSAKWASTVEESLRSSLQPELAEAEVLILSRDGTVLLGPPGEVGKPLSGSVLPPANGVAQSILSQDGRTFLSAMLPTRAIAASTV